jgi:hypothetical protein
MFLYPARSRWGTYYGCCSRRDGARTSVKPGSWTGHTYLQLSPRHVYWSLLCINSELWWYKWTVVSSILRILYPFIYINTDSPAAYKAAGHRSKYFCSLQLEHKASNLTFDPTRCSRDKHLARPHVNKRKYKETIFLPCLVCLLRNESVNKHYQVQKGEDSARWNKLMIYVQYIPQSCRKEKKNNV